MMLRLLLLLAATGAAADTVVATRTIRAQEIVDPDALRLDPGTVPGIATRFEEVIGLEARVTVYPGQALRLDAFGPPALVDRNQIVELVFSRNGLFIVTEGRALARGGAGDRVRVMNLSSRTVLTGTITPDGAINVAGE
ncbi:flagellar basal body P-ring formation chaperone FlgA [Salipiger marinus]|nr:flagellar basal body P-ring formation chaperone FlgA [Salipiger marinus]